MLLKKQQQQTQVAFFVCEKIHEQEDSGSDVWVLESFIKLALEKNRKYAD